MPSRLLLLFSAGSALILGLACGGSSTTTLPKPAQAPGAQAPDAPATVDTTAHLPLAFDPLAITCAPGDPIWLVPAPGSMGDGWNAAGLSLESQEAETGKTRALTHMRLGKPGQPVFACGRAPETVGTTHLRIRARAGGGWTEPRTVAVTVRPKDAVPVLRVVPAAATVDPGGRVLFKGFPPKGLGEKLPGLAFATAAPGSGTIHKAGKGLFLYTAPKTPGTYQLVMTHIRDGARTQVQVTVAQPAS